jgi:single-stranded-DNA-specific exonuclease
MGNPAPVYGIRGVRLSDTRVVGSGHLRARIDAGDRMVDAIAFGWADRVADILTREVDLAFQLERNEWNGRSTLQARLKSLAPSGDA